MAEPGLAFPKSKIDDLEVHQLCEADIAILVDGFARHNWDKPELLFKDYLKDQEAGTRQVWVAFLENDLAGYATLYWRSGYRPFATKGIPEIMDLNVLPPFRKQGIGTKLIDIAEENALKRSPLIGIGVGLYDGYGDAQKLYVKRGYIPDGLGPTYRYTKLNYGQSVVVDDDLVMWFTKRLS
jgi:GNAT superfamily N-acetyltransferase